MPRNITQALVNAFAADDVKLADLVEFQFPSPGQTVRFNSTQIPLDWEAKNWPANAHLERLGDISESVDLRIGTTTITLGGADQSYIAIFLSQNYIGTPVRYLRGALDDNYQLIGTIEAFVGTVSGCRMEEDETLSNVHAQCSSHWANFDYVNGRLTNDTDQQAIYPGDFGFEFAPKTVDQVPWGTGEARG